MNINELINHNANVSITIGVTELKEFAFEIANEVIKRHSIIEREEKYLTITETCTLLNVDKSTLWRWNKNGYLTNIRIGGKVKYRKSDINKILEEK